MFTTTEITDERLERKQAIGTFAECLQDIQIQGSLSEYTYSLKNGRQILLGHHGTGDPAAIGSRITCTQLVFMTRGDQFRKRPTTWEEARNLFLEGWVLGTVKKPGVKAWIAMLGRDYRVQPDNLFVYR